MYDNFGDSTYDSDNKMEVEGVEGQAHEENIYCYISFIVFWSCLQMLFRQCLRCGELAKITEKCCNGCMISVRMVCDIGHTVKWSIASLKATSGWLQQ